MNDLVQGATSKGFTDEDTIAEEDEEQDGVEGVVGKGGMQAQGGQGTANKARSKEAAAVLKGMRVSPLAASSAS